MKSTAGMSGPIRVLHVIESLGSGGAERLLHTNLTNLDDKRFQSTVVTLFSEQPFWTKAISDMGVPVVSLGCQDRKDVVRAVIRLRRLIREIRPSLIHTHLLTANLAGRLAGRITRIPVISSVHSPDWEPATIELQGFSNHIKRTRARYLDSITARYCCSRLIAVSDFVAESTARHLGYPPDRIDVLYNPVDVDELQRAASRSRPDVLKDLGLPPGARLLLNVGRVTPPKGITHIVRALPAIRARVPDVHFVSAGSTNDDRYLEFLRKEAEQLRVQDIIHFIGTRHDVSQLLHASDVFLFPSLYEGLGIALIEAMAAGRACVASDLRPLSDLIRHQENGWLVAPEDPELMSAAVISLLDDGQLRERLGRNAAAFAAANFRPDKAVRRLEAVYQSVLNEARASSRHSLP